MNSARKTIFVAVITMVSGWEGVCAAKGIPIIWGEGETIANVGELPAEISREVANELGSAVHVGYMYERFHLYYCDLWTWNGHFVLKATKNETYWELSEAEWHGILGKQPADLYGKPILYRAPLGLAAIAAIAAGYMVWQRLFVKKHCPAMLVPTTKKTDDAFAAPHIPGADKRLAEELKLNE